MVAVEEGLFLFAREEVRFGIGEVATGGERHGFHVVEPVRARHAEGERERELVFAGAAVSLIESTSRERESERSSRMASASAGVFTIVTPDSASSSCLRRTVRRELGGIWRYRVLNGVEKEPRRRKPQPARGSAPDRGRRRADDDGKSRR